MAQDAKFVNILDILICHFKCYFKLFLNVANGLIYLPQMWRMKKILLDNTVLECQLLFEWQWQVFVCLCVERVSERGGQV